MNDWIFTVAIFACILLLGTSGILWKKTMDNYYEELRQTEMCEMFKLNAYETDMPLWQNYVLDKHHICRVYLGGDLGFVQADYACSKMGRKEICRIIDETSIYR